MNDAPIEGRKYEVRTDENGSTTIRILVREGDNLAWYWLEERDKLPEKFVSIFPTSPLRKPDDIDRGIEHLLTVGGPHVYPMARNRETMLHKDVHGLIGKGVIWDKTQHKTWPDF